MVSLARLEILFTFSLCYTLFLLPGWVLSGRYFSKRDEKGVIAFLLSAGLGYVAFWMYFFHPLLGKIFSCVTVLLTFALIRRGFNKESFIRNFGFVYWIGIFYCSLIYIVEPTVQNLMEWTQVRFIAMGLPPDNTLPWLFAEHLYQGTDPRQLFGDWLSSDRPPLQTGITLLFRPILGELTSYYTALGTVAQLAWVIALVQLCRDFKLDKKKASLVIGMCVFSGFSWSNTVFVWPKFLAGGLTLFSLHFLLLWREGLERKNLILAALSFGLGMMSHGGVIFSFPILVYAGIQALKMRGKKEYFKSAWVTVLAIFFVIGPWWGYSRLYNPPGNRLIKYHLAEVRDVDPRPALKTIFQEYKKLEWNKIFYNKGMNFLVLFTQPDIALWNTLDDWRLAEFRYFFRTTIFLNLGWFMLLFGVSQPLISYTLLSGWMSLLFWCVLMFGPAKSYVWQGSYANNLVFFLGLGTLLTGLPIKYIRVLLLFQFIYFVSVWIIPAPLNHSLLSGGTPNYFMILASLYSLWKLSRFFALREGPAILELL